MVGAFAFCVRLALEVLIKDGVSLLDEGKAIGVIWGGGVGMSLDFENVALKKVTGRLRKVLIRARNASLGMRAGSTKALPFSTTLATKACLRSLSGFTKLSTRRQSFCRQGGSFSKIHTQ